MSIVKIFISTLKLHVYVALRVCLGEFSRLWTDLGDSTRREFVSLKSASEICEINAVDLLFILLY